MADGHQKPTVLVYGGGPLVSAAAVKLVRARIYPIFLVPPGAGYLRYHLSFGDAAVKERTRIEEVTAAQLPEEAFSENRDLPLEKMLQQQIDKLIQDRTVPVLAHRSLAETVNLLKPTVLVLDEDVPADGDVLDMAPLVVGMYPAHQPGRHCHVAVETRFNFQLGRVYQPGGFPPAEQARDPHYFKFPFTLCPSPIEGLWVAQKELGDTIRYQEAIGLVEGIEIRSPMDGQLWGLAHSGRFVNARQPIAFIFEGPPTDDFRSFGFREHAVAGAVLEAILAGLN